MIKAKCENNCIWKGKYWEAGELYTGLETPPHHFTVLEGAEESAPARKRGKAE